MGDEEPEKQLLHLVFGGELEELQGVKFRNLDIQSPIRSILQDKEHFLWFHSEQLELRMKELIRLQKLL